MIGRNFRSLQQIIFVYYFKRIFVFIISLQGLLYILLCPFGNDSLLCRRPFRPSFVSYDNTTTMDSSTVLQSAQAHNVYLYGHIYMRKISQSYIITQAKKR